MDIYIIYIIIWILYGYLLILYTDIIIRIYGYLQVNYNNINNIKHIN